MSEQIIRIQVGECEPADSDHELQYIPAKIKYSGEANVKSFFNDFIAEESGTYHCTLRGRPLDGKLIWFVFRTAERRQTLTLRTHRESTVWLFSTSS